MRTKDTFDTAYLRRILEMEINDYRNDDEPDYFKTRLIMSVALMGLTGFNFTTTYAVITATKARLERMGYTDLLDQAEKELIMLFEAVL